MPLTHDAAEQLSYEFSDSRLARVQQVPGGLVNDTYLLTYQASEPRMLQKLGGGLTTSVIDDMETVTTFLQTRGWQVPLVVPTRDKSNHFQDAEGDIWRLTEYIHSDRETPKTDNLEQMYSTGKLLARLHSDLRDLKYTPTHSIENFHNRPFYNDRLRELVERMPDDDSMGLSQRALSLYDGLPNFPESDRQLIHADPQINNILVRLGVPFCFIDFDTVMIDTVWTDIGDLIRSTSQSPSQEEVNFSLDTVTSIYDGYVSGAEGFDLKASVDDFLIAGLHVALGNAERCLIDCVENRYFAWDDNRFSSRFESNLTRAYAQFNLANLIKEHLQL